MTLILPQFHRFMSEARLNLTSGVLGLRRTKSEPIPNVQSRTSPPEQTGVRRADSNPLPATTTKKKKKRNSIRGVKSDVETKAKLYTSKFFNLNQRHNYPLSETTSQDSDSDSNNGRKSRKRKRSSSPKTRKGRSLSRLRASIEKKIEIFTESRYEEPDHTTASLDWKTRKEIRIMKAESRKIYLKMCKEKDEEIKKASSSDRRDIGM